MSKYWSAITAGLVPYIPGEQPQQAGLIKLNTNENPYPPSPQVDAAIRDALAHNAASLRLYPDPNATSLKQAIATHFGTWNISPAHVFVGNGSDEVLAHVFQALLKHENGILFPDITYSFYPVYCDLYQISYHAVPLNEHFAIEPDDYLPVHTKSACGGIIFPNPNAPTGCLLDLTAIEHIVAANPETVVVVDEAYIDFGGESAIPLIQSYPNLLVVQTLSKSRSLAGLRVGFAVGHPELILGLERVKNSFNSYPLDRLAIAGAIAALADEPYFEMTREKIMLSRAKLTSGMQQLGFTVLPSAANFIFAHHPQKEAATLAAALRQRAIIVRHFAQARIAQYLRISIGTDRECQALLAAFEEILTA